MTARLSNRSDRCSETVARPQRDDDRRCATSSGFVGKSTTLAGVGARPRGGDRHCPRVAPLRASCSVPRLTDATSSSRAVLLRPSERLSVQARGAEHTQLTQGRSQIRAARRVSLPSSREARLREHPDGGDLCLSQHPIPLPTFSSSQSPIPVDARSTNRDDHQRDRLGDVDRLRPRRPAQLPGHSPGPARPSLRASCVPPYIS